MAGGISRARLVDSFAPDERALAMLARIGRFSDDAVLRGVAAEIEADGIAVIDPVFLLEEALAGKAGWRVPDRLARSSATWSWPLRSPNRSAPSTSDRRWRCAAAWWPRSKRWRAPTRRSGARRRCAGVAWSSRRPPSRGRTCASIALRSARNHRIAFRDRRRAARCRSRADHDPRTQRTLGWPTRRRITVYGHAVNFSAAVVGAGRLGALHAAKYAAIPGLRLAMWSISTPSGPRRWLGSAVRPP